VWTEEGTTRATAGARDAVEIDLCDLGIVVLDGDDRVASANGAARELLGAESASALEDRTRELLQQLTANQDDSMDEAVVDLPGVGRLGVRGSAVEGADHRGRVLLLRDGRSLTSTSNLLVHAARHRTFAFLSRDWAHDLKGMLHVIRINTALLARLLQREGTAVEPALTKCLDAIPREVERLDRGIEAILNGRGGDKETTFDLGTVCRRLKDLIAARANHQRVEVALDVREGPTEISGSEDQVQGALLNVLVNALQAMPEVGRLEISVAGEGSAVKVRICDSGPGLQPRPEGRDWRPEFVNDGRRSGIGLHVTRAIVESHGGRIECRANAPSGTCFDVLFPSPASTGQSGRLANGSRTHR
jgi:signal transduction histidine kinase